MSQSTTPQFPKQIAERLTRLDRKVRWMAMMRGFGILAAVLAVGLGIALAIDFLFDISGGLRIAIVSVVGIAFAITGFLPS